MVSGLAENLPPGDWGILRQYPPKGVADTERIQFRGAVRIEEPYHKFGKSYPDTQIRHISRISFSKQLEGRGHWYCFASLSQRNKWIILQQGARGCTAAVTSMLIMDLGGSPDLDTLMTRNLGTNYDMMNDIKKAGFIPVESQLSREAGALKELQGLIAKNGSIIVGVNSGIGGHVVVVDSITDDGSVWLRDSYHGWEIAVGHEVFLASLSISHPVLQAISPATPRVA